MSKSKKHISTQGKTKSPVSNRPEKEIFFQPFVSPDISLLKTDVLYIFLNRISTYIFIGVATNRSYRV